MSTSCRHTHTELKASQTIYILSHNWRQAKQSTYILSLLLFAVSLQWRLNKAQTNIPPATSASKQEPLQDLSSWERRPHNQVTLAAAIQLWLSYIHTYVLLYPLELDTQCILCHANIELMPNCHANTSCATCFVPEPMIQMSFCISTLCKSIIWICN